MNIISLNFCSFLFCSKMENGPLGMPSRDYYLDKSETVYIKAYEDFMVGVAELLGDNRNGLRKQLQDVIEFETQLANVRVYFHF